MPDLLSKDITRTPLTNIAKSCEQKTKSHVCNPQDSGCLSAQEQRSTKLSEHKLFLSRVQDLSRFLEGFRL